MFGLVALVPLLGALSAAALSPEHMKLFPVRQLENAFPSQCSCDGALKIYNACLNGDSTTCLSVCQQSTFNDFIGCFQCTLDNTAGVSQSEWRQLQSAVDQIKSGCSQTGSSVTGGLQALSASGSSTATAAGGDISSASGTGGLNTGGGGYVPSGVTYPTVSNGATITATAGGASAAASGITIAASGAASAASSAAGAGGSAAGAAGSATSSAAAAASSATSPNSGAAPVTSFVGGLVALVSVAAGMAIAF
ncbi:hypothetical protein I302_103596 [Kwoniella bestiolae CBS 10118]|uniref:Extracellular membrane protein CFEM domain-containing protein n=1 Tax=Kwoniella bestiolae CBS 10118 TaxID=1296100 RepID=A0A1B9G8U4_9TREE|nr:hypothetical protein I302_02297 [Kwoniella bestiolae CBS 10118]OCF27455.1 hypothetical protein I302_02297 [Kwoniella bestiolae CBS 10118]